MTRTTEASAIKVGDQIRSAMSGPLVSGQGQWTTVIERESFKHGTRIWVRLENGAELTFCAPTTLVINTL